MNLPAAVETCPHGRIGSVTSIEQCCVQCVAEDRDFWRTTALELYAEQHRLQLPLREKYIEEVLRLRWARQQARPPKAELFEGCTAQEQAMLIAYELADS